MSLGRIVIGLSPNMYLFMSPVIISVFPVKKKKIFKKALADLVTEKDLFEGRLYPPLSSIREVSLVLAAKVRVALVFTLTFSFVLDVYVFFPYETNVLQILEYAYEHNMAALHPEPADKEAYIRSLIFTTDYDDFTADSYRWPEDSMTVQACKL